MTIAVLQEKSNEDPNFITSTATITVTLTCTGGSTLHVWGTGDSTGGGHTMSISDSLNGSYTALDATNDTVNNQRVDQFVRVGVRAGVNVITLTFSANTVAKGIWVAEIGQVSPGAATVDVHTGQNQQTPTTTTDATTSGNVANINYPVLVLGFCLNVTAGQAAAAGTGFTSNKTAWAWGGANQAARSESKRVVTTGNQAATFTANANVSHTSLIAVYDEGPTLSSIVMGMNF